MTDLLEKLKALSVRSEKSDAHIIMQAINRINELENKLANYEDDITDWQYSVETQMRRRKDD